MILVGHINTIYIKPHIKPHSLRIKPESIPFNKPTEEGEDDADKFSIDPDNGKITNLNPDIAPGIYSLVAKATSVDDPSLYDTTQVQNP